jgi:HlyD family secretion protein
MDRRIARKPWRKYAPWGAGVVVIGLAAAAYVAISPGAGAKAVDSAQLQITEVRRAPFADFVPARAEVAPLKTVFIDAVEGGQVASLPANDGDLVQAGALLAVLSNPQLEREVGAGEASVSGRISDVRGQLLQLQRSRADREREINQAQYDLLRAEQNLQIRRSLHQKGFLSDVELKTISDEAAHHRTRLSALRQAGTQEAGMASRQASEMGLTLRQLQENLGAVRGSLDALQVRAPVSGRLTAFALQPGQTVEAGERVGQIDTEGAYKLTARVDEFYLGRLSLGQMANVEHEGRDYRARVSRIFPQVTNGGFQIEMTFVGATPPGIRRGQSLDAEITLGDTRPALVLPNGPFLEATGGNWVFVLEPGGRRAERRAIRTDRRNPQQVEVVSGLQPGERVVTSSYDGFAKQTRLILR